jgi:hypothetical protein
MDVTRASLLQALATFTSEDEIGLWKFSTRLDGDRDYRVLVPTERLGDRKGNGTQRDRLSAAFSSLSPVPNGATGLYDTTLAAYMAATSSYVKGKFNALVLLTDGVNQDPGSISRSALVTRLQKLTDPQRPVPLIAIAVGPDADKAEVQEIAKATGGSGQQVNDPQGDRGGRQPEPRLTPQRSRHHSPPGAATQATRPRAHRHTPLDPAHRRGRSTRATTTAQPTQGQSRGPT